MSGERVRVCATADLPPGERTIIDTPAGPVGVFNIDGQYFAIENRCAHQGGPVCTGKQQGALVGEFVGVGKRVKESFSDEVPAIACPWHGWEYDLRTGRHLGDPDYAIRTFEVIETDGALFIEV